MNVKIYWANDQKAVKVGLSMRLLIKKAIKTTLIHEEFSHDAEISLTFVDNEGIRVLNRDYRGVDRETDVLSFPLMDFEGGEEPPADEPAVSLGDIVLSLEKTAAQAEEFGHSFEREAAFLCVHSMLHLLGYDHINSEEEDAEMRRRQREILANMGLSVK